MKSLETKIRQDADDAHREPMQIKTFRLDTRTVDALRKCARSLKVTEGAVIRAALKLALEGK